MKLKTLKIKNIASINEATIEFCNGVLEDCSIFLISGETGAGKSTIIDAICLALYGTTPKLNSISSKTKFTDEYINGTNINTDNTDDDKNQLSANNAMTLVRRGTVEAFAKLYIIGDDGKEYMAQWRAYRGTLLKANSRMSKKNSLFKIDGNNEIEMEGNLGSYPAISSVSLEQFTRTIVLPQGQTDRFIKGDVDEKCEILEQMTSATMFTEYGGAIVMRKKKEEELCKILKNELDAYHILSTEEENDIKNEKTKKETELEKTKENKKALETLINWIKEFNKNEKDINDVKTKIDNITKQKLTPEYKGNQQLVTDWDISEQARAEYKQYAEAKDKLAEEEEKETNLKNRYTELVSGSKYIEDQLSKYKEDLNQKELEIGKMSNLAEVFKSYETVIEKIKGYQKEVDAKVAYEISLKDLKGNMPTLKQHTDESNTKEKDAKTDYEKAKNNLEEAQKQLSTFNHSDIVTNKTKLDEAESAINNMIKAKGDFNDQKAKVDSLTNKIKELSEKKSQLEQEQANCKTDKDKAQAEFDKVSAIGNTAITSIRATLKKGDICPVCGKKLLAAIDESTMNDILEPAKKTLKEAQDHFEIATKDVNAKEAEIKAQNDVLNNDKQHLEKLEKTFNDATEDAKNKCNLCGLNATDTDIANQIKNAKDDFAKKEEKYSEQVNLVNDLITNEQMLHKKLTDASLQAQKDKTNYTTAQTDIKKLEQQIDTKTKDICDMRSEINEKFAKSGYNWEKDLVESIQQISKKGNKYNTLVEESHNLKVFIIPQKEGILKDCKTSQSNVLKDNPLWSNITVNSVKIENIKDCWNTFANKVSVWNITKSQLRKTVNECHKNWSEFASSNPKFDENYLSELIKSADKIKKARENLNAIETQLTTFKGTLDAFNKTKISLNNTKPETWKGNIDIETKKEELEQITNNYNELLTEIGGFKEKLKTNDEAKKDVEKLQTKLEDQTKEFGYWEKLNKLFGGDDGKNFRRIAMSYAMELLLKNANYYMSKIAPRYSLFIDRTALVIMVADSYEGGCKRPASTLSGGEMFMVSLCVALGLISLNSIKNTSDILFIDEGFGTLSEDCLKTVLDTLSNLSNITGGKKIGIISHVKELQETISPKIMVTRVKEGLSKVDVVA